MSLNPNNPLRLGRRQRDILAHMTRIGGGVWPPDWYLRADERTVMATLVRKGLITTTDESSALTDEGKRIAKLLGM